MLDETGIRILTPAGTGMPEAARIPFPGNIKPGGLLPPAGGSMMGEGFPGMAPAYGTGKAYSPGLTHPGHSSESGAFPVHYGLLEGDNIPGRKVIATEGKIPPSVYDLALFNQKNHLIGSICPPSIPINTFFIVTGNC